MNNVLKRPTRVKVVASFDLSVLISVLIAWLTGVAEASDKSGLPDWPTMSQESRPWTRLWWMGSAVDEANLSRELERYRDAGLGGIEVTPIYGAKGWEPRFVDYLSPRWMALLSHTIAESHRLGLSVDMPMGTGWCFGGPNIPTEHAGIKLVVRKVAPDREGRFRPEIVRSRLLAVVAHSGSGDGLDLTRMVAKDGSLDWQPPDDTWEIRTISLEPTNLKVKRAAPGGDGFMLNPFYGRSLQHYLARFDDTFAREGRPGLRAMFHDSFEYYGCDWSPDFLEEFARRRGYRLESHWVSLSSPRDTDSTRRVKCDYRETVSDLLLDRFTRPWVDWCHERGYMTRNQAHGSPGNWLDLYGAVDIPETEMYREYRNVLVSKFASSAAHLTGRRLVSAETGTWLAEHFTETLGGMARLVDEMFLSGVNHIVYHCTCYSPDEVPWPGWVFYASTELNPRNPIWRDVPALNAYISRCQSVLQSGRPDNDVLVYWPIHDLWQHQPGLLQRLTLERDARAWFEDQPIGKLARRLLDRGYDFDYVSDRQLAGATAESVKAVIVPECEFIPETTIKRLLALADRGMTIIFERRLPTDVPGLGELERRRLELRRLIASATSAGSRVIVGEVEVGLSRAGIRRETIYELSGLRHIRRVHDGGGYYFVTHQGNRPMAGWFQLAHPGSTTVIMDPMTGHMGVAASRTMGTRKEVYLQLQPGESLILRTYTDHVIRGPVWKYWQPAGEPREISGKWRVTFQSGGPTLPPSFETVRLSSWTERDDDSRRFAGTARYAIRFDAPTPLSEAWILDLGRVCQSGRVRLNGRELGTMLSAPYRIVVETLAPRDNLLEIDVTNVAANRIRDLDRRGILWRNFYDVNFSGREPGARFDASGWPLTASGLLGPVRLIPAHAGVPAS